MRLFLAAFLFDMVVQSLIASWDFGERFDDDIETNPKALPTLEERRQIAAGEHPDEFESLGARLRWSVDSLPGYFDPRPSEKLAKKLQTNRDVFDYSLLWYRTRANFLGHLVGIDQDWPMFSPNVAVGHRLARFRLIYADGTAAIVRPICDPVDLCRFSHWFEEKHLQATVHIPKDPDRRIGYCNMLAHRFPKSDSGAALVTIDVFRVRYEYPEPGDDPVEALRGQTGPPTDQIGKPFWRYDVKTGHGEYL